MENVERNNLKIAAASFFEEVSLIRQTFFSENEREIRKLVEDIENIILCGERSEIEGIVGLLNIAINNSNRKKMIVRKITEFDNDGELLFHLRERGFNA